jgi:hypothetical protein
MKFLDALIGKAKCCELLRQYDPAVNIINEILVVYPAYQPG